MKRWVLGLVAALTMVMVMATAMASAAQSPSGDERRLYRLRIQHADPQLIYRMLAGLTTFQDGPEFSTLQVPGTSQGGGSGNGGFGNSQFGGGRPPAGNGNGGGPLGGG